jgi:transposase-like protein
MSALLRDADPAPRHGLRCPKLSGQGSNGFSSGKERDRVPGKPKKYTPEFKEQAARRVVDNSLPIAQVSRELGINDTTLGFWVKEYRKKLAGQPLPSDMPAQERIRELERRNRDLEMELAFLKKAATYFAREHR